MDASLGCGVYFMLGCLALAMTLPQASGHAFLTEPPSRNSVASQLSYSDPRKEYCPHCLQGGGPTLVKERGQGTWPSKDAPESHGLCGDPKQGAAVEANWRDEPYLIPTPVQRTYTPGEVVEFQIKVNAHHSGHYEFRICDRALDGKTLESRAAGQECLDTWLLERAAPSTLCQSPDPDPDCQPLDEDHPERWHLPPAVGSGGAAYKMRYKIPEGLRCSHCTLQWYWATGNSCLYDEGYYAFFEKFGAAGWPASEWCPRCNDGVVCGSAFGEEFWNCADIAVLPADEHSSIPSPLPEVPSPLPTGPSPTPAAPSPLPTGPSPLPAAPSPLPPVPTDGCVPVWGKCGGNGWTGPSCCAGHCNKQSQWYHQCVPGEGPEEPEAEPEDEPLSLVAGTGSGGIGSSTGEGKLRGRHARRHRSMAFVELARTSARSDGVSDEDDDLDDAAPNVEL